MCRNVLLIYIIMLCYYSWVIHHEHHRTVECLAMLLVPWEGFMNTICEESYELFLMQKQLINESPGWNGFDWVIEWFYGGNGHPGVKEIDRRSCLVASMYNHLSNGLWLD